MDIGEFFWGFIMCVIGYIAGTIVPEWLEEQEAVPTDVEVVESIPHRTNTMVINDIVVKPKLNPHKREEYYIFTLDDGTPCVFISVPSHSSRKADANGASCDWGYQDDHELIF